MIQKLLTYLIFLVFCQNLFAQSKLSIERPKFMAGDTWTYRVLDGWSGNEQKQMQETFTSIEVEKLIFQRIDKSNNSESILKYDADINSCRNMMDSIETVCFGPFKFPMSVGQKISYEKLPFENGLGYSNAECVASTTEKLTLPAGTFETLRIDCSGYWQKVLKGSGNGSAKFTVWYASNAKRAVKFTEEVSAHGRVESKKTTELVSFKVN